MQHSFALLALVAIVTAAPRSIVRRDINRALIPNFGVQRGTPSAKHPGNCRGLHDAPIPCFCPPDRDPFIAKLNQFVAAGKAGKSDVVISFPEGNDPASIAAQNHALITTMQNFNDTLPGVGCPSAAAVFKEGKAPSGDAGHAVG